MTTDAILLIILGVFLVYFIIAADRALKMLNILAQSAAMMTMYNMPKDFLQKIPSTRPMEKDKVEKG